MSMRNVGIVYRKELTEAVRDRRTVISAVLVPLLLFPVLSVGFGSLAVALVGKAKEEVPKVMLRGGEDSPAVVEETTLLPSTRHPPCSTMRIAFEYATCSSFRIRADNVSTVSPSSTGTNGTARCPCARGSPPVRCCCSKATTTSAGR